MVGMYTLLAEFGPTAPEELTDGVAIFMAPPGMPLPEALLQGPIVGAAGVFVGNLEIGERTLRPLREFASPAADIFQSMPYSAAQTMADFLWPKGNYNYWKSNYLPSLNDECIDTILDFYSKSPSPRTVVVLEHNGVTAYPSPIFFKFGFGPEPRNPKTQLPISHPGAIPPTHYRTGPYRNSQGWVQVVVICQPGRGGAINPMKKTLTPCLDGRGPSAKWTCFESVPWKLSEIRPALNRKAHRSSRKLSRYCSRVELLPHSLLDLAISSASRVRLLRAAQHSSVEGRRSNSHTFRCRESH